MFIRDDSEGVYRHLQALNAQGAPETVFEHVASRPVRRVLIEKIKDREVISLQCDGGSVVGDVPSWMLRELAQREMLPSMLGSYLRDMGYL